MKTLSQVKASFKRIDRIKRGGQKTVYKAVTEENKVVALKLITNASDPRVIQEISIVKEMDLDHIPRIIESGVVVDESINEEVLYIVEQYVEGESLRDWLGKGNKADIGFAYDLLYTLLSIEMCLEKKKILHRDINPNNIIWGIDSKFYLIDFGLAKRIGVTSLTRTDAIHGPFTPGYAPHEQYANIKMDQDVRTDLFQIGVTVYECCKGRNPFIQPADTIDQIMYRTMSVMPPLIQFEEDKKGLFAQLIHMLMSKNQSQRPDTAEDAMRYLMAIKGSIEF